MSKKILIFEQSSKLGSSDIEDSIIRLKQFLWGFTYRQIDLDEVNEAYQNVLTTISDLRCKQCNGRGCDYCHNLGYHKHSNENLVSEREPNLRSPK